MSRIAAQTNQLFTQASTMHRQGNLAQAWQLYQRVLQSQPDHFGSLHSMGIIAAQTGRAELAVDLIGRAVAHEPGHAAAYNNLGNALKALKRYREALENYDKAIDLKPGNFGAYNNRGIVLRELDQLQAALESCEKAVALKPDFDLAYNNRGIVLEALGQYQSALESYGKAIALRPGQADFHNNRGNALRKLGRHQEALESYDKALALKPDYVEAYYNRGMVLGDLDRHHDALESLDQAIRLKPDYVAAYNNRGNVLVRLGQHQAAVENYQKAIELDANNADAYNNLGSVLKDRRQLEDAVECYRKAVAINPDFADAHNNLGKTWKEIGDLDKAMACHLRAIELDPANADSYVNLADVYFDLGQFDKLQEIFTEIFAIQPEHPGAWALRAEQKKMTMDDAGWLETAQKLVSDPGLSPDEQISLWFAIGKFHDDTRQFDLAFPAYQRANELQEQLWHSMGTQYDHVAQVKHFDELIRAWPGGASAGVQPGSSQSSLPLFIIGMPRSGTSLSEQIMSSHPQVFGAGELRFWGERFRANHQALLAGNHDPSLVAGLADGCEKQLRHYSSDASRIIDKMPHNFTMVGLINEVFPKARFIHMRRNPVDTCLSIYFHHLNSNHAYATSLEGLVSYYREYERLMQHWRTSLPPDVLFEVQYEELVEDVESWSRRIIEFIGLEWDQRCLDFHETERKVGTFSNWQVRQKIYKTSTARWKNYEQHLGPLLELLDAK